jgi:heptosyltransferase-2
MKILIVKIGAIGDVVMTLPILKAISDKYGEAQISWLCGTAVGELLSYYKDINNLIIVNENKLFKGSLFRRLLYLFEIWGKLFGDSYDLVIIGNSDPRYRLMVLPVRAGEKRAFTRNGKRHRPVPGRYHGDEYVNLLTGNEGPDAPKGGVEKIQIALDQKLAKILGDVDDSTALVAIAPGGTKNLLAEQSLRRWPLPYYRELVEKLLARQRSIKIVLTGGIDDDWVSPVFKDLPVLNLIGKTSIPDLISIFSECKLIITHDSGPLHLAKLAGTPTIGLFGPVNPFERISEGEPIQVIWGGRELACCPCYDGKSFASCLNNICMQRITVDMVYNQAATILKNTE